MLVEIVVWDKTTQNQKHTMVNPDTFVECVEKVNMYSRIYILTTSSGKTYEVFESEIEYLEKEGYIKRFKSRTRK